MPLFLTKQRASVFLLHLKLLLLILLLNLFLILLTLRVSQRILLPLLHLKSLKNLLKKASHSINTLFLLLLQRQH